MNKISFIIEFDEVSKIQEEQLTEFIEKTGIKFHVLESDNDLKKYKNQKEVIDKAIEYIEKFIPIDEDTILMKERQRDYLLDILKEVKTC